METPQLVGERNYVLQNQEILRQKYQGIIAVLGEDVIASGKSRDEVIHQAAEKVGKRPILIGSVDDIVNSEPVLCPSPQVD